MIDRRRRQRIDSPMRTIVRGSLVTLSVLLLAFAGLLMSGYGNAEDRPAYEIWAVDQGTGIIHIYDQDYERVDRIDLGEHGVAVPHMIDFTSDYEYAVVASVGSDDTTLIRTSDREVVDIVETGPRSHMATVRPGDAFIDVAVIGDPEVPWDGEIVELALDKQAGSMEITRRVTLAEDSTFQAQQDEFRDSGPICQEYAQEGAYAYVTLGPGLADGGLLVLDTETLSIEKAYGPDDVRVNCGTMPGPDGNYFFVNGGSDEAGTWYVFDQETHEPVPDGDGNIERDSRGLDAHGGWITPDGEELWMVNRVTDNAIVIDPRTLEIIDEVEYVGTTPDIMAISPDSKRGYVTLRGPNPVTAAHVAEGDSPGFSVIYLEDRELQEVIQPDPLDQDSDFHGIGVRPL